MKVLLENGHAVIYGAGGGGESVPDPQTVEEMIAGMAALPGSPTSPGRRPATR
jgi:hypothetical protein